MEQFKLKYESTVNKHGLSFKSVGHTVCVKTVDLDSAGKKIIRKFEGTIIGIKRLESFANASVLVRSTIGRISIEKLFVLNSPIIHSITVISGKKTRRAKLYYLRGRIGKRAKLKTLEAKAKE